MKNIKTTTILTNGLKSLAVIGLLMAPQPGLANPLGGQVVQGSATITQTSATRTDINQTSQKAIINWDDFSIGAGEHTNFNQPNANAVALNRVVTTNPSNILGRLTANGKVMIVNPNGVFFGKGSQVDVGALVATTSNISNADFMNDQMRFTAGNNPNAKITNEGMITVKDTGLVALVAPQVENNGIITAKLGKIALGAGDTFTLDFYGDDLVSFAVDQQTSQNIAVTQNGTLQADGGVVAITAAAAENVLDNVINMNGLVQAQTIANQKGEIVLLAPTGTINVAGKLDTSGNGNDGGRVEMIGQYAILHDSAVVTARGANGGFIETSGTQELGIAANAKIDAGGETGFAGTWLLDPTILTIANGGAGTLGGAGAQSVDADVIINSLNANTNVNMQATNQIIINEAITATAGNANLDVDAPLVDLNQKITLNGNGVLSGTASTVNVGSKNASIQNGVDILHATNGGTVNVAQDRYNEFVTIGKNNVTLTGDRGATNVAGAGANAPTLAWENISLNDATDSAAIGILEGTDNVTIEGFIIENFRYISLTPGIFVEGNTSNVTIRDNTLIGNSQSIRAGNGVLQTGADNADSGKGPTNLTISYNDIRDGDMVLRNADQSTISNNTVTDATIQLTLESVNGNTNTTNNNVISNNTLVNTEGGSKRGILINVTSFPADGLFPGNTEGGDTTMNNLTISNNNVTGYESGIDVRGSKNFGPGTYGSGFIDGLSISNNTVDLTGVDNINGRGIFIMGSDNVNVANNTITATGKVDNKGISIFRSPGTVNVDGNTITNVGEAIEVVDIVSNNGIAENYTVTNNIINNSTNGLTVKSDANNVSFTGNTVLNSTDVAVHLMNGTGHNITGNTFTDPVNAVTVDPGVGATVIGNGEPATANRDLVARETSRLPNTLHFNGAGVSNLITQAALGEFLIPAAGNEEDDPTGLAYAYRITPGQLAIANYFIQSGDVLEDEQNAIRAMFIGVAE